MKRLIYTFALLFVTLGAMAYNLSAGKYIYFEKPSDWSATYCVFMIGKNDGSSAYTMTKLSNTNLYYWKTEQWNGYTEWAFFNTTSTWSGWEGNKISNRKNWAAASTSTKTSQISSSYNLITTAGAIGSTGTQYTFLNKTHTIKVTTNGSESTDGGSVSATSYALNSATAVKKSELSNGKISVVYTATVTLTAAPTEGYIFAGWYDGETHLSGEETYSYQAENSEKTITAKFVEMSGNNVYLKPNSNWTSDNARFSVYFYKSANEFLWFDMTKSSHSDLYECPIPTGFTSAVFCRMNPVKTENNFNNGVRWNQTDDLTYDGSDKNIYVIIDGEWQKGYWMNFDGDYTKENIPSSDLYVRGSFNGWGTTDNIEFDIYAGENGRLACTRLIDSGNHEFKIATSDWNSEMNSGHVGQGDISLSGNGNIKFTLKEKSSVTFSILGGKVYLDYTNLWFDDNKEVENAQYGTINFQKTISGDDINKWHWISLPYDVKISDIQGGVYGADFIIQEYNTAERAEWKDNIAANNKSAWRQMEASETLLAGKGYILAVNNEKSSYSLTFVSETDLNVVVDKFKGYNTDFSAEVKESANWHLIGTGVYGMVGECDYVNYVAKPDATGEDYTYHFLGKEPASNFNPTKLGVGGLEPYTAFFVQHTGDYSFSKVQPAQNAAPRRARAEEVVEQYYVNIVGMADTSHTAIFLAEDGSDDYVVGQDFLHLGASGESLQFYSKQGKNDLAFNYLKKEERTIALGGYVAEAGKYTISLTADGKASSVILYDSQTGEATDLLQYDYEFDAEKGYLDGRFDITIAYAAQDDTPTDIEIGGNGRLVVLNSDGIVTFEGLAIGEEVVIYDIMGRCVNHFVASNDVANVMLADGVYVMKHSSEIIKFVVNR